MARHRSRRHRSNSRRMKGGSYTSASTYGGYVSGSGDSQFSRTLNQEGSFGQIPGNVIIGAQGQNVTPVSQIPNAGQLALVQTAGRRRRRGGFLGEVVNQAIVPLTILGMQQTYRRKRGGKRHTRRHTRRH
jgi:hypothetical protein